MTISLVNYDLNRKGQNWDGVRAYLASFDHHHLQGSAWYIRHSVSRVEVFNQLRALTDLNDEIDVVPIDNPEGVITTDAGLKRWLKWEASVAEIVDALLRRPTPSGLLAATATSPSNKKWDEELSGVLSGIPGLLSTK